MIRLLRTVRFSLNPPEPGRAPEDLGPQTNSFAAYPTMRGLGRHYELDITCLGEVNPQTGYLINIRDVDQAARLAALPVIAHHCLEDPLADPARVIRAFLPALGAALERLGGRLGAVVWRLSPYYRLEMETTAPDRALIRQQFELAASHRLHVPTLSAEQNRTLFGKCNNPKGHGHNYRVEPCVEVPVGEGTAAGFGLADLERITQRVLISRFDHTHLNEDMPEFSSRTGVNPSVENIAQVFFRLLAPAIKAEAGQAATLRSLTVWETDKTAATYPA